MADITQIKVGTTTYDIKDSRVDGLVTGVSSVNGKTGTVTIENASTTAAGLMSKDDKSKLDGIATVATSGSYDDLTNKPSLDDLPRIKVQGYAPATRYYKLATFPEYNSSSNYASLIITGRMGGWEQGNMSFVNMLLYNRNGEGGGYISVDNSNFYDICDIVMYRDTDGTSTAYLKVNNYYTFDISINTFQATNAYKDEMESPSGTLKWTASVNADRLAVSGGEAYINGSILAKASDIPTFNLSNGVLTITA